MKLPQKPPPFHKLVEGLMARNKDTFAQRLIEIAKQLKSGSLANRYLHWDELRRRPTPDGFTPEDLWIGLKFNRSGMHDIPLCNKTEEPFRYMVPESVHEELHQIDIGAGGSIGLHSPITNPQTRDRYLIRSLIEEAITSSQLEGAVTTREVAKEMIRSGRTPRDKSEQMIMNNYMTMQRITELRSKNLTPKLVFDIHRFVTRKTLDDPNAEGRFRRTDEHLIVGNKYGEVFHEPPSADELPGRMNAMCDFANSVTPKYFIHPVIRAIIIHFWLAYDHPFVDGNGRTARALFYWSMLRNGCWLFEFISISNILRKMPAEYGRSFLYTETDDNDLTYFIISQSRVIRRAIKELHDYIDRKTDETRELERHVRNLLYFNHRQAALLRHALKHPYQIYTISSHQTSHNVVYQTARTDLLDLASQDLLEQERRGRQIYFSVPTDLASRLKSWKPK